jgi:hypothetical protein
MEQTTSAARPTLEQLRYVANHFPIIDNHAHNLILPTHADSIPFESITTEAQGRALRDTFKSLSHLRAAKQLRNLYECGEDETGMIYWNSETSGFGATRSNYIGSALRASTLC